MAVTVVNTLYPPLIETFQPAFLYTTSVPIVFSLSPFNSINDIKSIHISIVDQRNNSNVLKMQMDTQPQIDPITKENTEYQYSIINGILIAEFPTFEENNNIIQKQGLFQYDSQNNLYAINISPEWLNKTDTCWNNNQYYQVQIRFDKCDVTEWQNSITDGYMLNKREYFSEWSSVTLIKPILEPVISIAQLNTENITYTSSGTFHVSGCVVFKQDIESNGISWPETERLQSYRVISTLKVRNNIDIDQVIDDSGWIYARQNILKTENTVIDYLLNLTDTENKDELTIEIICRTNNGYIFSQSYNIKIQQQTSILNDIRWNNKSFLTANDIDINQEDGIANIEFSATCTVPATVYFRRACSKDNFTNWDIIYYEDYVVKSDNNNNILPLSISFKDYTIGSLYQYQYSVQTCTIDTDNQEQWSKIQKSNKFYPKFYDMLLMRQNKQIAIRYNGQIASWKPTVNRQKIDTLGGRYPKFVENAVMNYKTYSISGLITAEEDFNRTFLDETVDNNVKYYDEEFNTKYIIRNDSVADGEVKYTDIIQPHGYDISGNTVTGVELYQNENGFSGQLNEQHDAYPQDHWYWEREFREQLVNWLNDGEPKLYRSMPEGNLAVILTDINLTPNAQLGRRLYNFSATMYEIGDGYSLEELDNLHIINLPRKEIISLTESKFYYDNSEEDESDLTEPRLGQMKISTLSSTSNWINGTGDVVDVTSLWDSMSLKERLDEEHMGYSGYFDVIKNSIRLKNIEIQFTTPPHYFTYSQNTGFQFSQDNQGREIETEWLGYVIIIQEKNTTNSSKQIFINQKGYYHIPDSINVQNLQILNDNNNNIYQTAEVFYQYQYRIKQSTDTQSNHIVPLGDIVGQFSRDSLPLDTNIIPLIYQDYQKTEYKNRQLYSETYLKKCLGLMLDVTPYTYIKYIQEDDSVNGTDNERNIVVGQTGIFNAFEDWPLKSLEILGRRMIEVNEENYPYHIEEWQYYINNESYNSIQDIINPQFNMVYTIDGHQQIYYIDRRWYPIEIQDNSSIAIAKVPIYGMINYHGELERKIL